MELHRLGFKFFAHGAESVDILKFIPVFHRWIQNRVLEDVLIDVADYTHLPNGPGVMLVAHEGNYGFDEADERRGLVYYSKRPLEGALEARLLTVCRKALQAWALLAEEPVFEGALRFAGDELRFFANDRLLAPNTDETWQRLESPLRGLFDRLFADTRYRLERESDPRARFGVRVRSEEPVELATLLSRLVAA